MKVSFRGRRIALSLLAAGASVGLIGAAQAQTKLEISVPWGPNEFHSLNAAAFAKRISEETKGQLQVVSRPGGELGVKANESVRAVADGVVPMADLALFQNASRGPAMAVETLPFLVNDYEQLQVLHKSFRPLWESILSKNNQKMLYIVPWPKQFFFTKKPVQTIDDLKGLKMRSLDKLTTDWINRLGMVPVQLTNLEILQALGSGMLEGVPTSAGTAVAQMGLIAFVGLAAPHVVRAMVRATNRWTVVLAALAGGLLLLLADLLARGLIAPQEIPVGVLTAVLGGGYLLWRMSRMSLAGGRS
jgi:TRAP-type C4-dicarboxylate transport system substrate-binding protein